MHTGTNSQTQTTPNIYVLGSPLCFRIDMEHLPTSEISFLPPMFKSTVAGNPPEGCAT